MLAGLEALHDGWHDLRRAGGPRPHPRRLCPPEQFTPCRCREPGADNDLNELFDRHLPRDAHVYAFGEPWGPDTRPHFGFARPGTHDVHPNQGNVRQFGDDDGVWQDGGLIVGRTGGRRSCCAFSRSPGKTDDRTGHAPTENATMSYAAHPQPHEPVHDRLDRDRSLACVGRVS